MPTTFADPLLPILIVADPDSQLGALDLDTTQVVNTPDAALALVKAIRCSVVLIDLANHDGDTLARKLMAIDQQLDIVLVGGTPTIETERCLRIGRPVEPLAIRHLARTLADRARLRLTNQRFFTENRARQSLLQAVIDYAPLAIVLTDNAGRIRLINRGCEQAMGVKREQVIGSELISLLPEALREAARERLAGVLTHGEISENEREMADPLDPGQSRRYLLTTFPVTDDDGERGLGAIAVDITQRKALEEQLLGAQRMEAIGRLAGGISHDFNNLLTAILGYAELLRLHLPRSDDRLIGYATEISRSGQRAANLTSQLLAFSRLQVLAPQVIDLNRLIRDLERSLARLIGEEIALEIRLDHELGAVRVDPPQIEQVVLNLVINAREALLSAGRKPGAPPRVVIATARMRIDEHFIRQHRHHSAHLAPGTYVCLAVTDNGPGMDATTRRHIFEPFFTAKSGAPNLLNGKGAGLGLATAYGIVQQSEGFIDVDSAPGRGSSFRVLLPMVNERATPRAASSILERAPGGHETILLVEDQDEVRVLLEKILCDAGYTVLGAEDPNIALDLARQFGGRIDVMVTDVVMPSINGYELRNQVLAISPGMKVIFMSGYPDRELNPSQRHPFLQKPFNGDVLLRTVRQVLES